MAPERRRATQAVAGRDGQAGGEVRRNPRSPTVEGGSGSSDSVVAYRPRISTACRRRAWPRQPNCAWRARAASLSPTHAGDGGDAADAAEPREIVGPSVSRMVPAFPLDPRDQGGDGQNNRKTRVHAQGSSLRYTARAPTARSNHGARRETPPPFYSLPRDLKEGGRSAPGPRPRSWDGRGPPGEINTWLSTCRASTDPSTRGRVATCSPCGPSATDHQEGDVRSAWRASPGRFTCQVFSATARHQRHRVG